MIEIELPAQVALALAHAVRSFNSVQNIEDHANVNLAGKCLAIIEEHCLDHERRYDEVVGSHNHAHEWREKNFTLELTELEAKECYGYWYSALNHHTPLKWVGMAVCKGKDGAFGDAAKMAVSMPTELHGLQSYLDILIAFREFCVRTAAAHGVDEEITRLMDPNSQVPPF